MAVGVNPVLKDGGDIATQAHLDLNEITVDLAQAG
jgi:hypothetical protein